MSGFLKSCNKYLGKSLSCQSEAAQLRVIQSGYFHEKYCQKVLILCKMVTDLKQKAYIELNYNLSSHLINKLTNSFSKHLTMIRPSINYL